MGRWIFGSITPAQTAHRPRREWPFEKKLEYLWRVDVMATIRLSRDVGQRMTPPWSGWRDSQHRLGSGGDRHGRRQRRNVRRRQRRVMAFTRSRQIARPASARELHRTGLDQDRVGRAGLPLLARAGEERIAAAALGTPEDVAQATSASSLRRPQALSPAKPSSSMAAFVIANDNFKGFFYDENIDSRRRSGFA